MISSDTVFKQLTDCLNESSPRVMNFTDGELYTAKLALLRMVKTINTEVGLRTMCASPDTPLADEVYGG